MTLKNNADNREFYRFEDEVIIPVFARSNEIQRISKMVLNAKSDRRAKDICKSFFGLIIDHLYMDIDGLNACSIRFSGKRNRWSERSRRAYLTSDSFHRARESKQAAITLLYNICHEVAHGYMISIANTSLIGVQHNREFLYALEGVLKAATAGEISNIHQHRKSRKGLNLAFEELGIGSRIKSNAIKRIIGNDLRQVIEIMSSRTGVSYMNPMQQTYQFFIDGKIPVFTFQAVPKDGKRVNHEGVATRHNGKVVLYYRALNRVRNK